MITQTSCNLTQVISDAKAGLSKIPNIYPALMPKRLGYLKTASLFDYKAPYDLTEVYRAIDTESFISATLRKKILLILKGGYTLISKDERNISYIKKRLAEIEYVSDTYFEDYLLEFTTSLIYNHNAFTYLVRNPKSSSGLTVDGKKPIAGFYVLPEYKVTIKEDEYEQVEAYNFEVSNYISKEIKKDNIIHSAIDKKIGTHYGTPPLESVRDDILSLRQIEESLERLIYKLTSPLIHVQVGNEKFPAGIDRTTRRPETDFYSELLENMDDAGGITTSERVNIKLIGAESQALRLESPLKHYVNRVLMGLNTSEVDLGLGNSTTSGAAEIISESLKSNIEMYQYLISNMITNHLFNSLLLESSRYSQKQYIPKEERVVFKFEKSDITLKLKIESHYLQEVNAGLITKNEYRIYTGRPELTDLQIDEMIQEELTLTEKTLKLNQKYSQVKEGTASSNPKKENKLVEQNVINPKNQFSDSFEAFPSIPEYVDLLILGRDELANEVLFLDIKDSLEGLGDHSEKIHKTISSLTITLQKYIIDKVPSEILKKRLSKTLDDLITEIFKED